MRKKIEMQWQRRLRSKSSGVFDFWHGIYCKAKAVKSEWVEDMCGIFVVFVIVLQLFVVDGLSSLSVAVFVSDAGGGRNKV